MHFKQKIARSFTRACRSYDGVASVQLSCAKVLTEMICAEIKMPSFRSITDLGAGTGFMTQHLFHHFPHAAYTLNDLSPDMLSVAQHKLPKEGCFHFDVSDMEELSFPMCDLVVSNLAIQWLKDPFGFLVRAKERCRVLAFSTLLDGTFQEWYTLLESYGLGESAHTYPKLRDYQDNLAPFSFVWEERSITLSFPSAKAFLFYLKTLGAQTPSFTPSLQQLKHLLRHQEAFHITYRMLLGVIS